MSLEATPARRASASTASSRYAYALPGEFQRCLLSGESACETCPGKRHVDHSIGNPGEVTAESQVPTHLRRLKRIPMHPNPALQADYYADQTGGAGSSATIDLARLEAPVWSGLTTFARLQTVFSPLPSPRAAWAFAASTTVSLLHQLHFWPEQTALAERCQLGPA